MGVDTKYSEYSTSTVLMSTSPSEQAHSAVDMPYVPPQLNELQPTQPRSHDRPRASSAPSSPMPSPRRLIRSLGAHARAADESGIGHYMSAQDGHSPSRAVVDQASVDLTHMSIDSEIRLRGSLIPQAPTLTGIPASSTPLRREELAQRSPSSSVDDHQPRRAPTARAEQLDVSASEYFHSPQSSDRAYQRPRSPVRHSRDGETYHTRRATTARDRPPRMSPGTSTAARVRRPL